MSALMLGTLKGTTPTSLVAVAGLCVALVPLGVQVLRSGSAPDRCTALAQGGGAVSGRRGVFLPWAPSVTRVNLDVDNLQAVAVECLQACPTGWESATD